MWRLKKSKKSAKATAEEISSGSPKREQKVQMNCGNLFKKEN